MHSSVSESPGRKPWVAVVLLGACALLELSAAAWILLLGQRGSCPLAGGGFSCAALIRPRLSELLGPLSLAHLAIAGGLASLALTQLFALAPLKGPLARWGPALLAAAAGFALGVQPGSWAAVGALCPLCLLVALGAAGAALAASAAAWRSDRASLRRPALACALALAVTAPVATLRGRAIASEDAQRRAAVLAAGDPAHGPGLLLVVKPGCPYCEALILDTLGDPRALERLERSGGVSLVEPGDPRLEGIELEGTPTLLAPGRPALSGRVDVDELLAWLDG